MTAWQEYRNSGLKFTPSQMSVADFLNYWLDNYGVSNFKDTTLTNYRKKIKNHIVPAIGKYPMPFLNFYAIPRFFRFFPQPLYRKAFRTW